MCAYAAPLRADGVSDASSSPAYRSAISGALREYERGNWEEAEALFARAHALQPSARTFRGMGLTAFEGRRYADASRYLQQALTDTRHPLTVAQRKEVADTAARAQLFLVPIWLNVVPASAQIKFDGIQVQPEPDGSYLHESGALEIEASAEGYEAIVRRVRLVPSERFELSMQLTRLDPAQDSLRASQALPAPASAEVARPEHSVLRTHVTHTQSDDAGPLSTWKWLTGGVSVATLLAGGGMLIAQKIVAKKYYDDCFTDAPPLNCTSRERLSGHTLWNGSMLTLSLGGALAATSAVLFVLDANRPKEAASAGCRADVLGLAVHCKVVF